MFLFELPQYINHVNANELIIKSKSQDIIVNLLGAKISRNIITNQTQSILFTTPNIEKSLVNTISYLETEYLITKLNDVIKEINMPEHISMFHYDQIFNNNLFKFYNSNMKITHIATSNDKIIPTTKNLSITVNADVQEINQKVFNKILKAELNDSLIFIKINNRKSVNIYKVVTLLAEYAYILNLDQHNNIITIKLKFPIDFFDMFQNINNSKVNNIVTVDRTNELSRIMNK